MAEPGSLAYHRVAEILMAAADQATDAALAAACWWLAAEAEDRAIGRLYAHVGRRRTLEILRESREALRARAMKAEEQPAPAPGYRDEWATPPSGAFRRTDQEEG